jgi:hypothetical protein
MKVLEVDKIVKKAIPWAMDLIGFKTIISYQIICAPVDEVTSENFIMRINMNSELRNYRLEVYYPILIHYLSKLQTKEQKENYIYSLVMHEITHAYFHDYFELLPLNKKQREFLFERIALVMEQVVAKLLEVPNND